MSLKLSDRAPGEPADRPSDARPQGPAGEARPRLPATVGRFKVEASLGRGSFGNVYKAYDPLVGEHVALKLLRPELGRDRVQMERLRREVVLARKIDHPGVCRIHDLQEDGPILFVVMELLDGESLDHVCARGPLPAARAVDIIEQVCRALAAAHDAGVLHRDIKPSNVMVRRRPDGGDEVTLVDFGIALGQGLDHLTQPGIALGTVGYLAPELWEGRQATPASDVFATGAMLYGALTGRLPWRGPQVSLLQQMQNVPAAPPSVLAPPPLPGGRRVDARLDEIVLRAIAARPEDRLHDARVFADALATWQTADVDRTEDEVPLLSIREDDPPLAGDTAPAPVARRRLVPVVLAGAMALGVAAVVALLARPDADTAARDDGATSTSTSTASAAPAASDGPAAPLPAGGEPGAPVVADAAPGSAAGGAAGEAQADEEPVLAPPAPRAGGAKRVGSRSRKAIVERAPVDRALVEKKLARLQRLVGSASTPQLDALAADIAADIAGGRYVEANAKLDRALALAK